MTAGVAAATAMDAKEKKDLLTETRDKGIAAIDMVSEVADLLRKSQGP